ncbi:hypothetical protein F5I97DRAFT_1903674 [Phlebopus sp. FC_14]|nr:hypothetical protein F5I97DRAFT_1903674 [Phlebopus sp. FC_14]
MFTSLDSLEEKFRQVEEASERQALVGSDPSLSQIELVDPQTHARHRPRRKQSVSVSRFGQPYDGQEGRDSSSTTTSPLFAVATKSTFYHSMANPRSFDSFISEASEDQTYRHLGENQHVTQIERIAGRHRLSRSRSQSKNVPHNKSVVIGISVERTTSDASQSLEGSQCSTAYATKSAPLRPRASTIGLPVSPGGRLLERARSFARKLQRKSGAEHPSVP